MAPRPLNHLVDRRLFPSLAWRRLAIRAGVSRRTAGFASGYFYAPALDEQWHGTHLANWKSMWFNPANEAGVNRISDKRYEL